MGRIDGRTTADHATVRDTGFNRPEDMEIQTLANGDQILYSIKTTDSDNDGNRANGRSRVDPPNLATDAPMS